MRNFLVTAPSFIAGQLVAVGSPVSEAALNGATPGSNLVEVDENGSPIDPSVDLAGLLSAQVGTIAPVSPHAPNPTRPQAIPGQQAGGVQLAEQSMRYAPAEGVTSNADAAARIAALEAELEVLRGAQAVAGEQATGDLQPEPPQRRESDNDPLRTVETLAAHVDGVNDPAELRSLREQEASGRKRTGALAVIDRREAELSGGE